MRACLAVGVVSIVPKQTSPLDDDSRYFCRLEKWIATVETNDLQMGMYVCTVDEYMGYRSQLNIPQTEMCWLPEQRRFLTTCNFYHLIHERIADVKCTTAVVVCWRNMFFHTKSSTNIRVVGVQIADTPSMWIRLLLSQWTMWCFAFSWDIILTNWKEGL